MSDIEWADERREPVDLIRSTVPASLALGALAGAAEFGFIGAQVALSLAFDEAIVLGLVSVALGMILALVLMVPSVLLAGVMTRWESESATSLALGLLGGALSAWHLWAMGLTLLDQPGRGPSAAAFFAMPLGVVGVVHVNAKYWIRKAHKSAQLGLRPSVRFVPLALGVSALLVAVTSFASSGPSYGSGMALDTDAPVLIITVDSLRRDHVSTYGEGVVSTPSIDELGEAGVVFENAVTPFPETAPAHAAMFVGMHPVRMGVLSNGHALHPRYNTLAEMLEEEGYATAAFVSSFAVDSRSGLDQGFQVYDDDFFPAVRGLNSIRLSSYALRALMRFGNPVEYRSLLERDGEDTLGRALSWLRDNGRRPFFMWVHLFEPHAPYETHGAVGAPTIDHRQILANEPDQYDAKMVEDLRELYAEEVLHTDALLGDFLDAVRDIVDRPMTIVFAADHGELLGEHGIHFNHHGIYDETVRVPLIVVPHKGSPVHKRIPSQVRLMDIPNTVLAVLGMDTVDDIESGDLTAFWNDTQDRDYASFLMGRMGRRLDEGTLFGYRAAQTDGDRGSMLKYIWSPGAKQSWLYDLSMDPDEAVDISLSQAAVVQAMEQQVRRELGTAAPEGAEANESETEALKALGYLE